MKNTDLISKKLEEALVFLYEQEDKLKPILDTFNDIISKRIKEEDISFKDAFDMMLQTQEQYTNSILLITKIKEIIDFKL